MDEIELIKDLLKINSVSGNEKEIGEYIVKLLKPYFKIKTQQIDDSFNIFAYNNDNPKLILTTHIDTVMPFFDFYEDKEYLFGRGACDTKGLMASMLSAGIEASKEGLLDFGLIFDVREETDFGGIKEAIKFANPEFVVVGEPTNFDFVVGQKGLLELKVIARGKAAHSAVPENGVSAIEKLLTFLNKLKAIKFPCNGVLGKTTLNIGKITGGTAANIVPDYAEAELSFRLACDSKFILGELQRISREVELKIYSCYESVCTSTDFLKDFNNKKTTLPYFTELGFWNKSRGFVFGPGDAKYAHSADERIRKEDVIKGKKEYLDLIKKLSKK